MTEYVLRLLILLPLVAGLAWGALVLWKKLGGGWLAQAGQRRRVRVVDALPLGTAGRLAVIEFDGRSLLVAVGRNGITLLGEGDAAARPDEALPQ